MDNMAHRPKPSDDIMDMDSNKPNDNNSPAGAGDDTAILDLTSQPASTTQPNKKPNMRFDPSTFGSSSLASKLPSFLEELARANRETEQLIAANPKAARIEINSDDSDNDDDQLEGKGGGRQVIEMNLYSGILEPENPDEKRGEKKEIVMPNGLVLAGGGGGEGDEEPFISEPVEVRHTNGNGNGNDRKRRASSSSSSGSESGSSSSEGETRVIKIPISALQQRSAREKSPAESEAGESDESAEHTGASSSRKEVVPPRTSPKKKIVVARKADGSLSSSLKDQDVQDWVDSQPSTTGEYDEIEGAPKRKMLIPKTRVGSAESQQNVQDWVNRQADQEQGDHQ